MTLLTRTLLAVGLAATVQAPVGTRPAVALETEWVRATQAAEVRLIAGRVEGGVLEAGLEFRLAPGWKTYWRYPGDSGVPPRFEWAGSTNVAGTDVSFPAPRRFSDGGNGYSIGYKGGGVLLPMAVRLAEPQAATQLDLSLDFAVCEALCVPAHAQLTLTVPAGGAAPEPRLAAARAALPAARPLGGGDVPRIAGISVDSTATPPLLTVNAVTPGPKADLFVEGPDESWALPLPTRQPDAGGTAIFTIPLDGMPTGAGWAGATLRLTLVDGEQAIETPIRLPEK